MFEYFCNLLIVRIKYNIINVLENFADTIFRFSSYYTLLTVS